MVARGVSVSADFASCRCARIRYSNIRETAAMNGQHLVAVQPFPLDFLKDALPQTASEALSANL